MSGAPEPLPQVEREAERLRGLSALISGGSRGIGLEIARSLARAGCRITLVAKTDKPHPTLPGTIHEAADELRALGAEVVGHVGDIRDEATVIEAASLTAERFGGIDLCINNASAIDLRDLANLPAKRFDLVNSVNVRGTFVVTKACLPYLRESTHAHVLTLSPPLNLDPLWFEPSSYAVSKYGMTIVTLGLARTEAPHGIAANCLWPRTAIATAAVKNLLGGEEAIARSRIPAIVADAATLVLAREPASYTGNAAIVEDVLAEAGVSDLSRYSERPGQEEFLPDFFLDSVEPGAANGTAAAPSADANASRVAR